MALSSQQITRKVISELPFHNTILRRSTSASASPNRFSIMNFNLLAKCYGSEAQNKLLSFEERRELNSLHVKHILPSILVCEEMDECYISDFEALDYQTVKASKKNDGKGEYTGIFFHKSSKLKSLATDIQNVDKTGERGQFAIFCLASLEIAETVSKNFVIVATHAKAGRTEEMENHRVQDAKYVFEHLLPEFLNKNNNMELMKKVIYIGDFNASPHSYGGKYPCKIVPWLLGESTGNDDRTNEVCDGLVVVDNFGKNPVQLVSAQKQFSGEHPLFTTCKERDGAVIVQTIDYVLLSPELGETVGVLETPSATPETELAPHYLPCPKKWGSDHISVYAEIEMK